MQKLFFVLLFLAAPALASAQKIECTDPASGKSKAMRVKQVERGLSQLESALKRRGIHILDLPQELLDRRRRLPLDLQEKDWCMVWSHLLAIDGLVAGLSVDSDFVSEKFGRVERWARASELEPESRREVDRLLANAAAAMGDGRAKRANEALNRVLAKMLGTSDPWHLPSELPDDTVVADASASNVTVSREEVASACPALARKGAAGKDDAARALRGLRAVLDDKKIRPLDLDGGEALLSDLVRYVQLSAYWPAARVACALRARAEAINVDLGAVMKRFQRVNALRDERGVAKDKREAFSELVRRASDHIVKREMKLAHSALDELLVVLGEPATPSEAIPSL